MRKTKFSESIGILFVLVSLDDDIVEVNVERAR